jgi:low temperature requirement protein LtrA
MPWTLIGATLILVAGFTEGARAWLWLAALAVTYVGGVLSGTTGWHLHPAHLAERHGLVVIIALGEAFISIGIGLSGIDVGVGEVAASILGLLVATAFWLAYFDFFAIRGERMLVDREGPQRVALARDLYAYAHLPMIVGIVLFAFAMKIVVGHVDDELDGPVAFALCGGSALYLLSYSAIRFRLERRLSRGRFLAAVVLAALIPAATTVPALGALALVTCVWLALHAYELLAWRDARDESRSLLAR